MNLFKKIGIAVVGMGMAVGVGVAANSGNNVTRTNAAVDPNTEEFAYTLSMKSNSTNSDSNTAISESTPSSYLTDGASYVSSVSSGYCYLGKSSLSSLKFGSSSKKGTITFTLSAAGQVKATNLVFHFGAYDTSKRINFSVNGKTSGTGYGYSSTPSTQGNFTDYTLAWDGATDLTSIKVEANGSSSFRFYLSSITVYVAKEVDPSAPVINITNSNKLAPHGVGRVFSATIDNDNSYSISWTADNANVSISPTSTNSGGNVTITASNAIAAGTKIIITGTLNDGNDTSAIAWFIVSSKAANSTSNAISAGEAYDLVNTGDIDGETLYVKGYANNSAAKYFWLSDNEDTTKTFEVYNSGGVSSYAQGTFIVAHGSAKKYNSTTMEVENASVDSADYFSLENTNIEVNNTQYIDVVASNATGNIAWNAVAGTGSVSLSNQSNSGVRITGTSAGTATVTATLGNLSRSISVTVNKFATDWAFKDITLAANGNFQDTYYVGGELDTENLTVDYIEHSDTLDEDRHPAVNMNDVTFNFDSSSVGTFNLTATYSGHTTDDVITITIVERPNGIEFNSLNYTKLSNTVLTDSANDSNDVEWTISATFSGSVSISKTAAHIQIGAGSKRADSVQITADLGSSKTFTKLAFKCDAFSGDSGTISLKLDGVEVASGNIDATSLITIEPDTYVKGREIQIDIENSENLRVNLISVEYQAYTDDEMVSNFVRDYLHMSYDEGGTHGSTGGNGSCKSLGWYTTAKTNYGKLLPAQKSLFNSEAEYDAAKQRLVDWAKANDEIFNPADYSFTPVQNARLVLDNTINSNSGTITVVVIMSVISLASAAGYFFLRRRKEF